MAMSADDLTGTESAAAGASPAAGRSGAASGTSFVVSAQGLPPAQGPHGTPIPGTLDAAGPRITPVTFPAGAVIAPRARSLEDLFIQRFEQAMAEVRRVPHPIEQQLYSAAERDRIHLKRSRSDEVVDLMRRHRIFDRGLFDELPLDQISEYRIVTRSFFGKKEVRVVVAAASVSPLEDFIRGRCSLAKCGAPELDRAIQAIGLRDESFYYVGILSPVGWERGVERYLPSRPNVLCSLVENKDGTEWRLRHSGDERWGGLTRLFDPESDREKIDRARRRLETDRALGLRGGHIVLTAVRDELNVSDGVLEAALEEILAHDKDLSREEVGGKWILKRRRL